MIKGCGCVKFCDTNHTFLCDWYPKEEHHQWAVFVFVKLQQSQSCNYFKKVITSSYFHFYCNHKNATKYCDKTFSPDCPPLIQNKLKSKEKTSKRPSEICRSQPA